MDRRHATDKNIAKLLRLINGRSGFDLSSFPTGAHVLKPQTVDEFIALGASANKAVWQYFQRLSHAKNGFDGWLYAYYGLRIPELNWMLQELRREASWDLPVLPLDRRAYHFVPRDTGHGEPTMMVLYPHGPAWYPAVFDGMIDPGEYGDGIGRPSVNTRIPRSALSSDLYSVSMYSAAVAQLGEFKRLLKAPASFRQAWCKAAEVVEGGSTAEADHDAPDPAEFAQYRYKHDETVVFDSLTAYMTGSQPS